MSDVVGPMRLTPLTDDMRTLLERTGKRPVSLGEMLEALGERGTAVVIILMAAPFVLPIPLPGLSIPFGIAIALLGVRLGLGHSPWLPGFLRRRAVQHATLERVVATVGRVTRPIERLLRPSWPAMTKPGMHVLTGVAIAIAAAMIMPPIPIPGFNAIPSLAIVLFAFGLMESDGRAITAGYVVLFVAVVYFYVWWDTVLRVLGYAGVR